MKILLSNSYFYPALGGIENYLLNIAHEFIKQGHSVTVFTMAHLIDLKEDEIIDRIRIRRFRYQKKRFGRRLLDPFYLLIEFRKYARIFCEQEKFDLHIVRDLFAFSALYHSVQNKSILYIQATAYPIYIHHSFKDKGSNLLAKLYWHNYVIIWAFFLGSLEKKYIKLSATVCVLSLSKLKEITKYYNINPFHYKVIAPGVDTRKYFPASSIFEKRGIRMKLKLPTEKRIALFVGRFEREKNPEGILESVKGELNKSIHIVFVGNHSDEFIDKVKSYGLEDSTTIVGPISEPHEYYRCADFFILPSLTEGFGQVIIEAMASGLPVVGFKNPKGKNILANEEIIENLITGILLDYVDYKAMGDAINYLGNNDDQCRLMGQNAVRSVTDKYSWEITASKLLQLV